MSTITSLVGTDGITTANSMMKINTNFTNLNTDKIETSVLDTDTSLAANSDDKIATQKAVKAYVDGLGSVTTGLQITTLNAGATINGANLPVPVYQNTTDNEVYACDGNNTAALKFIGFAVSNSTNGNPIDVKVAGIVSGFTGLDEGVAYYLSDTAGTIQNTPGTYSVMVGVAVSQTELVIQKGRRYMSGVATFSATGTSAIVTGFRPDKVRIHASTTSGSIDSHGESQGGWTVGGGNLCVYNGEKSGDATPAWSATTNTAWYVYTDITGTPVGHSGTVTSVTSTGFTLSNTKASTSSDVFLFWEAEGDF